ncbi:hypothetical protein [Gimibacter soli]|uniref:Uncharacterized protein n=1 Tax=Gimibacter soli TaxID=3024400 RepID=A0AAF0BM03_9PROT|nr:hypothetical protein [Gimibacter soli]WCL54827.1 hypothetical protein PH603_03520 [Gimibacter soli]
MRIVRGLWVAGLLLMSAPAMAFEVEDQLAALARQHGWEFHWSASAHFESSQQADFGNRDFFKAAHDYISPILRDEPHDGIIVCYHAGRRFMTVVDAKVGMMDGASCFLYKG